MTSDLSASVRLASSCVLASARFTHFGYTAVYGYRRGIHSLSLLRKADYTVMGGTRVSALFLLLRVCSVAVPKQIPSVSVWPWRA